jgi:hypothetical protein
MVSQCNILFYYFVVVCQATINGERIQTTLFQYFETKIEKGDDDDPDVQCLGVKFSKVPIQIPIMYLIVR